MISRDEALNIILQKTPLGNVEEKHILDSLNRVLSEDIYSKDTLPPFSKSAMDGYAIKSEETAEALREAPIEFNIIGTIKAGDFFEGELQKGEAIRIMTGAPLPKGADAVIQFEKVKAEDNILFVYDKVKAYRNVIKRGEEINSGDLALAKGTVIRPFEVGLLASLGYSKIPVYRTPTVALIITGDELINIEEELYQGKIRNSNEYTLISLLKNAGLEPISLGMVKDNKKLIKEKIEEALKVSDIVVTSGGASKGDYDFVEDVLVELGADIKFNSVAIKPGKPLSFAVVKDKLFFSLPGNPLAAITTFQEFIIPACDKFMGKKRYTDILPVILKDDYNFKKGKRMYIYVNIQKVNGAYYGYKIGWQSSSGLASAVEANGVVIVPEEKSCVKSGEILNGYFIFS